MAGTQSQRVLTFLSEQGIAVKRKNKVTVDIDRSCKMAQVKVNGKLVMVGNFWDFHPGCHGFYGLPSFSGHDSLAQVFVQGLEADQRQVNLVTNEEWTYRD